MGRKGRALVIAILGFLIIIVVGVAAAGNNRVGNPEGSAESPSSGAAGMTGADESQGNTGGNPAKSDAGKNLETYLREQDTIMADMMRDMEDIPKTGSADIDFLNGMIPHHESAVAMAESFLKNGGQNQKLVTLAGDIIEVQNKEIDQMKSMIERLEKSGKRNEEKEEAYLKEYQKMFASHQMDHSGMMGESSSAAPPETGERGSAAQEPVTGERSSAAQDPTAGGGHTAQDHMTETSHAAEHMMESSYAGDHMIESSHAAMEHMADSHGGAGTAATVDGAFAEGMILHHQMAVDMAEAILEFTEDEEVESLARAIIEAQEKEIGEMQEILDSLPRL